MKFNRNSLKVALLASTVILPQAAVAQDESDDVTPETIEVIGRYIPQEKRQTSEISSVAKSADFTRAGDSDIAVALTRLPGISPDSTGKYVVIRGLSERYTSTLLNGTQLPSPDPLKSAVPLDIFPTSMIDTVLVQKTYSAEYPGAFGGGVIDIRTKTIPDEPFFKLSMSTGYNTESTGKNGLSYYGSETDWLGWDDGKRSIPKPLANNPTLEGMGDLLLESAAESIANVWSIDSEPNYPDFDLGLSMGTSYELGEGDLGVIFALDYGSQFRNKFGERYSYSASTATDSGLDSDRVFGPEACVDMDVDPDECGYRTTTWDIDLNAFGSLGYKIGNHELKFSSVLLRSSQQQVEMLTGRTDSRDLATYTRLDWKEREVWSNGFFGTHYFDLGGAAETEVDWFASFTEASRIVPMRRTYEYFYDEVDFIYRLSARTDGNQTIWGEMQDEASDYGVTIKHPGTFMDKEIDFKFGVTSTEKDRTSDFKRYGYDLSNVENRELRERIPEIIFGTTNIDPQGIFLREFIDASDSFTAEFKNTGAFAQADMKLSEVLRLSGGVRYEDSNQIVASTDRISNEPIVVDQTLEKWLPSATLTWTFYEDMQLRFGYSETVNRPDSRELSPARFVREDGRTEEGNPNLLPATIKNFDMRYEWYIGSNQSVTVGAFYKEITNPIEYTIKPIGDGELDFVANADDATLTGIEAEADIILGSWAEREFFLKVNGSYIDSEVTRTSADFGDITTPVGPLQGQSKWLANAQLGYTTDTENLNLIFNYIGERIYRLGTSDRPDLIETPPMELNFVYSRDFEVLDGRLFTVSLKAKNLLNDAAERTQGGLIAETYEVGRSFSIGFSFEL